MSAPQVFLHIGAAIVLAGVVCRLDSMGPAPHDWRERAVWHAWVVAHVLIGLGMVARLFHFEPHASYFVTGGLALYFGVRWRRRAGDL